MLDQQQSKGAAAKHRIQGQMAPTDVIPPEEHAKPHKPNVLYRRFPIALIAATNQ
jgi:hypothetical protein